MYLCHKFQKPIKEELNEESLIDIVIVDTTK